MPGKGLGNEGAVPLLIGIAISSSLSGFTVAAVVR
jgi:hypothetical protein